MIEVLTSLSGRVQVSNSLNLTDVSVHSEDFYSGFLNRLCGWNLTSSNIVVANADTIDLEDCASRFCVQVTARADMEKLKDTAESFKRNGRSVTFDRLIVLRIGASDKPRASHIDLGEGRSFCLSNDLWDVKSVSRLVYETKTEVLSELHRYVVSEYRRPPTATVANEMQTFFRIIDIISNAEQSANDANGFAEAPDPEDKIIKRFAGAAETITSEYVSGMVDYRQALVRAKHDAEVGAVRERRLARRLRVWSSQILETHSGDAMSALEHLCSELEKKISFHGINYDIGAIRYYIIDQLVACNVFPLREVTHGAAVL